MTADFLPGRMQATPLTLRMIFDRMRTIHGDGRVIGHDGTFTYAEAGERILRMARALVDDLGVCPGDRVASFGFNTARHFELYYAVPLVGAVLHTVNVRLFEDQIAYIVNHAADRVMFVDDELIDAVAQVAPSFKTVERYVRLAPGDRTGDLPGLLDGDELVAAADPLTDLPDIDENAAFGLCYTSGTTGMPKGVLSSHRGMVLHTFGFCMAGHLGLLETDVVFPVVPLFHAFGWGLTYAAPFVGAELVLHGSDSTPEHLGGLIDQHGVTVAAGVPTIWKQLLPLLDNGTVKGSTLRQVAVGGSASPRALIEAYENRDIPYLQIWGMTETGPAACASRPRRRHAGLDREAILDVKEKTGTIFSGLEARITDPEGVPLPWDGQTVGELEVRGPWIASSYYGDEGAEKFNDGWLRTGDVAWMEPDGYFRIVDRAKDLVKSGGEWISSVELEGEILAHPDVADAAVIGLPHPKWDERPVAVIVPADPGAPPDLASIHTFLADRVAKWWLPDQVVVVDEIPKTSVGKLDKKLLRAQLEHVRLG